VSDEGEEDIENHPWERLWEQPNPFFGRASLMAYWAWSLLLTGEAYLFLRPVGGQLKEIWPIPPWAIEPIPDPQAFIAGYKYDLGPDKAPMRIDSKYIVYSRLTNIFDPRRGMSPLVSALVAVESDLSMRAWNRNFFSKENAAPSGMINELKSMQTLKFSQYKRTPDLFEEISEEQGTEGEIQLSDEVVTRLMLDKECLEYLINKELDEVRSNLNSIYSSCYGDTLVSEWYDSLWGVLEVDVVDSRQGEDYQYQKSVWLKDGTRGTKTAYGRRYKVTKCLFNLIVGWLGVNKNKNGFNENSIEYFGGYIKLMKDAMEYGPMSDLRVPRLDEYPDYRKMNKCINDNVESYF
jgi:hypothetical protein